MKLIQAYINSVYTPDTIRTETLAELDMEFKYGGVLCVYAISTDTLPRSCPRFENLGKSSIEPSTSYNYHPLLRSVSTEIIKYLVEGN